MDDSLVLVGTFVNPRRLAAVEDVDVPLERASVTSLGPDADLVALANSVAGNVHALAIDLDVAMANKLSCLGAGGGPARAVHDIVETEFKKAEHVLAGHTGTTVCLVVDVAELPLVQAVRETSLLLFLKLNEVFTYVATATCLAVISWRIGPLVEGDGLALGAPDVGA